MGAMLKIIRRGNKQEMKDFLELLKQYHGKFKQEFIDCAEMQIDYLLDYSIFHNGRSPYEDEEKKNSSISLSRLFGPIKRFFQ